MRDLEDAELTAASGAEPTSGPRPANQRNGPVPVVGGPSIESAEADLTAYAAFPRAHWGEIASTKPLERITRR